MWAFHRTRVGAYGRRRHHLPRVKGRLCGIRLGHEKGKEKAWVVTKGPT